MARIIDGSAVSKKIQAQLAIDVPQFAEQTGITPGLAVVLIGDDPASAVYVKSKGKSSQKLGMKSETILLSADSSREQVLDTIARLNGDPSIHGILVQLPLPKHLDPDEIIDAIDPCKDVDGLHPANAGLLSLADHASSPARPPELLNCLKADNTATTGKHVVVLGRSNLVGRPIATLLSLKGEPGDATVTICHSRSKNLTETMRSADILIVAIGQPRFVKAEMVSPNSVVIDVGIHRLPESEGGGLCGDVDFVPVSEIVTAITPVPGGVGPMTIAMLMQNTFTAAKLFAKDAL